MNIRTHITLLMGALFLSIGVQTSHAQGQWYVGPYTVIGKPVLIVNPMNGNDVADSTNQSVGADIGPWGVTQSASANETCSVSVLWSGNGSPTYNTTYTEHFIYDCGGKSGPGMASAKVSASVDKNNAVNDTAPPSVDGIKNITPPSISNRKPLRFNFQPE